MNQMKGSTADIVFVGCSKGKDFYNTIISDLSFVDNTSIYELKIYDQILEIK